MRPPTPSPARDRPALEADLVAVMLPPGPAFVEALDAAWSLGDAVAPVDPGLPDPASSALLDELRPSRLVTPAGEKHLERPEPVAAGTALVVATSGSTGPAKGVVLSHEALQASVGASLARLGCTPRDRWLCCLPTHHVAGLSVLLRARALGHEAVIHPRFDPAWVAAEPGITHLSLVPTQLGRLLDAGVDIARFAAILLGGGPAPAELLSRARTAGATVVTSYGMTETCGGCVYDGVPLAGVEVDVGADHRIRLRGPMLFSGYRARPELTAAAFEAGWLITPDVGHWQDGRLVVDARADDVIVSGGENIPGGAVAATLRGHPGISDAAVTGEPDPEWGQAVTAWVVASGPDRPSNEELRGLVAAELGRAAAPRVVRWVPSVPRTGLGKVAADALGRMRDDGDNPVVERD